MKQIMTRMIKLRENSIPEYIELFASHTGDGTARNCELRTPINPLCKHNERNYGLYGSVSTSVWL